MQDVLGMCAPHSFANGCLRAHKVASLAGEALALEGMQPEGEDQASELAVIDADGLRVMYQTSLLAISRGSSMIQAST